MIDVVIVSEIRVHREGLARLLEDEPGVAVVGQAAAAREAVALVAERRPRIVLLDAVGETRSIARALRDASSETNVVVVGLASTDEDVVAWAEAGVIGYVDRDASRTELVETVHSVARGEAPISPRLAATLLRRVATLAGGHAAPATDVRLTKRELEIVALIDEGLSNKAIAQRLCIELPTVKNHVHNVLDKLNVRRRSEAAALVRRRGLASERRAADRREEGVPG